MMTEKKQKGYYEALLRIEECSKKRGKLLDLNGLGLSFIPRQIGKLRELNILHLMSNQLRSLPSEIGKLSSLKALYLWHNKLTTLPLEIFNLTELTELYLNGNKLTALPPHICNLQELKGLYLNDNKLRNLPSEIGKLTALENLQLSKNRLSTLPPEIFGLTSLKELDLGGNQFSTLPPEIGKLTALKELDLAANQLRVLPPEIGKLTELEALYFHQNPALELPPSILGPTSGSVDLVSGLKPASPADILDYYFQTRGAEGRALREVKVIFVGRGEVGKSSMVDALQGKPFIENRPRTDGVFITSVPVALSDGDAELTFWDFGGQELMHGTHRFFLTHRSLYVIMVDGRHDRGKQDAEYWLKLARIYGGDSPLLLVMNRQVENPFAVDTGALAQKYHIGLDHFFRTDCHSGREIDKLKTTIKQQAEKMLAAEERFPARCWNVKTRLAAMKANGENYFSDECYQQICKEHGVENEDEQHKLLRRLADLGTVVSFPDDVKMAELSVLNPEWATEGIYRVVTNKQLREEKHGHLSRKMLRQLLPKKGWPQMLHVNYVLSLMEKFELCFQVDGHADDMLVPELLPDETPPLSDWIPEESLVFQYQYTILPHGILPRFITRTHHLSQGRERWRTGVVIVDDGSEARIQADYEANTITIWLRGKHLDSRRALLKVIRSNFDFIHAPIEALEPQEMVAIPGHPTVLVSYKDAIADERRGKTDIAVTLGKERVDYPLAGLLGGVEKKEQRELAAFLQQESMPLSEYKRSVNYFMKNDYNINVGGDNNGQIGGNLTGCVNMIQQMPQDELRHLLEKLTNQLAPIQDEMAGKQFRVVEAQVATLVGEAKKPADSRDHGLIERTAKGLIEVSETVGKIATPLIATVKGIASLLGG